MMPGMDGYEVCRRLKSDPLTSFIPVIFVSAMSEVQDEVKGFDVGGVDYITKPLQPAIVERRVSTHLSLSHQQMACNNMIMEKTSELEKSHRAAIDMLGEAGHFNDTDTGVHIWRMAEYSKFFARAYHWSVPDAEMLGLAAPMHDTGKIGIPDAILKAPRKLTVEEFEIMKTHTTIGHRILSMSDAPLFQMASVIALYHHEKWNGKGYPEGLKNTEIPEVARIVALADVFDALTMDRPYKRAWSVDKAVELIRSESGEHFDPVLVDFFLDNLHEVKEIRDRWNFEYGV
jgi:putative two-component system response regulator